MEDFLISTSRREAISAPVQAPVPGRGIPTNSKSPRNSYFLIWSLFPIALFSSFVIRPLNVFVFFIHLKICRIKSRINGIGTIFPTIQIGSAFAADIFSKEAARRPPRSSRIGIMEMMNKANSFPKQVRALKIVSKFGSPLPKALSRRHNFLYHWCFSILLYHKQRKRTIISGKRKEPVQ